VIASAGAPEWAHDPKRLWNAAEAAENRKNSTLAARCSWRYWK
jgi:hypothetical protein